MKIIKAIIEIAISAFIGIVAGFILILVASEGIGFLLTAGIVGIIVGGIVSAITENQTSSKLYTVFSFIISAGLYLILLININESPAKFAFLFYIVYFLPYVSFAYILLVLANKK